MPNLIPKQALINLKNLNAKYNQIQDITVLTHLKSLQSIHLQHNKIKDISSLAGLNKLKKLHLGRNQIQDILPLKDLLQLEELGLNHNPTQNHTILANLKQLKYLYFEPRKTIQDISFLKHLDNLIDFSPYLNLLGTPPIFWAYYWHYYSRYTPKRPKDFSHLSELPYVDEIWQIISNGDEENINLAQQLALSQGWTEENFEVYLRLMKLLR